MSKVRTIERVSLVLVLAFIPYGITLSALKPATDAVVSFENGRSVLSDSARSQLSEKINVTKTQGEIVDIQIAAWSDNPVPREGEELSKADRDLADNRAKSIKDFVEERLPKNAPHVKTYNMAERASWLARLFNTKDDELKKSFNKGKEFTPEEFRIVRDKGGSSVAVVLFRYDISGKSNRNPDDNVKTRDGDGH